MKILNLRPMEWLLVAILSLALTSCDLLDKAAVQYVECRDLIDCEEDTGIDAQPYEIQAQNCGGAADVIGEFDVANNSPLYTDTSGQTVYYHRFVFFDNDGNQVFTTKYADYTQLPSDRDWETMD